MKKTEKHLLNVLALFTLLALGIYLRICGIDKSEGMWYDELNTYFIAKQHFPFEIFKNLLVRDLHFPLYYLTLHNWMSVFGDSDIALRALSVLFGIMTLPVSYLIGRELYGNKGGLATLCFFSINSGLIYFSQEVRFYSALVFFCTLAALFLIRISKTSSILNGVGLMISNVLIIYTSTIGCVFVFLELALFLIYLVYTGKNKKHFLISSLGTFALSIPIIPLLVYFSIKHSNLLFNYFDWYYFDFSCLLTFMENVSGPFPPRFGIENNILIESLVLLSMTIFCIFIIKSMVRKKIVLTLLLIGFVPFLLEVIFSLNDRFAFNYWHFIFSVPFFIIAASCGLFQFKNNLTPAVLVSIYLTVNLSYLFFSPNSVLRLQRADGFNLVASQLSSFDANNKDLLIIIPFGGYTAIKYEYKARISPISLNDYSFYNGDAFKYVLEPALVKSLNKDNVCSKLKKFAYSQQPTERYKSFIEQQLDTIPKNRYIFVVALGYIQSGRYNKAHMIDFLRTKILKDTLLLLGKDKEFRFEGTTTSHYWIFYKFKRIK